MEPTRPVAARQLDYRTPGVGGHRVQFVVEALTRDEALGTIAACGKVALGLALTLLGPLLVASFIKSMDLRFRAEVLPSFAVIFWLACLVCVPLLLWLERRTRGEYLTDAARGETSPLDASSLGEYEVQKGKLAWMAYVESALLGPRLLWHVFDWARGTPAVQQPVRVLAAEVVVELLDAGEGMPVRKLVRPGRTQAEVQWAIRYLLSRDWADLSSRKDRVWLTTPTRERLERDLAVA